MGITAREKRTGDSTSSDTQGKQLGEGPAEAKTYCAPAPQAAENRILAETKPAAKESN